MDTHQFDRFTRSLSIAGSRRGMLGTALSGVLVGLGLADPDEVAAARSAKCRRKPGECERCDRGKCEKKDGKKRCKAGKIKPKPFGTPCSLGTCQNGACIAAAPTSAVPPTSPPPPTPPAPPVPPAPLTCPQGLTNCNGVCRNLDVETANCGACGRVCPGANQACCSGVCQNLNRDPSHCGACGNACASGVCCRGECCPQAAQRCELGECFGP
jgi:hypothetical protein